MSLFATSHRKKRKNSDKPSGRRGKRRAQKKRRKTGRNLQNDVEKKTRFLNLSTPVRDPPAKSSKDEKPATQALHFHHPACTDRFSFLSEVTDTGRFEVEGSARYPDGCPRSI